MSEEGVNQQILPLWEAWEKFLHHFFNITEKFPKKARFTFTIRLENFSLEVLELLIEARYSKKQEKLPLLKKINLLLEKMRVFTRVCYEERFLSSKAYEKIAKELDQAGRQIGGWLKELQQRI
ncbi:MAG: diversity-generating retroelement protein Avd [Candidatus Brocadiae bacterium]|nr:diversity-generating retroelement protein Avd [Candidatus Brocadiia bacterium]